jgi:LemA protein
MSPILVVLLVILVLLLILGLAVIVSYNRFVTQRNLIAESWRQVDVELQRRHDLIPNLVETVRGYAAHERQVFDAVTTARAAAENLHAQAAGPTTRAEAENVLSQAVTAVVLVAENYPQLRASENYLALQRELVDTEDRIAAGRRFYNGNVRAFNVRVESVPSNLIASRFHFEAAAYFPLDDPGVRAAVKVDLGTRAQ